MNVAHAAVPVASLPGGYAGPLAGGGNITDINRRGVYNEYQDRYDAQPVPADDRYNPNYDPRYDPTYQPPPPAPVQGQQVLPQTQPRGLGGFLRRPFGN